MSRVRRVCAIVTFTLVAGIIHRLEYLDKIAWNENATYWDKVGFKIWQK